MTLVVYSITLRRAVSPFGLRTRVHVKDKDLGTPFSRLLCLGVKGVTTLFSVRRGLLVSPDDTFLKSYSDPPT